MFVKGLSTVQKEEQGMVEGVWKYYIHELIHKHPDLPGSESLGDRRLPELSPQRLLVVWLLDWMARG